MIGCLILELILSKNGSSSQNGVDFIPFSVDCSNCQSIYLKDIFLHKDQALKMEQCYELKKQKFDLEKYKNLLRDDKFICFKEVLGRLLEPKSENRVGNLSMVIEEIKKIQYAHEKKMNENFYGVHQNLKRISLKILWIFLFFIAGLSAVNFVYLQRLCYRAQREKIDFLRALINVF